MRDCCEEAGRGRGGFWMIACGREACIVIMGEGIFMGRISCVGIWFVEGC